MADSLIGIICVSYIMRAFTYSYSNYIKIIMMYIFVIEVLNRFVPCCSK